MAEPGFQIEGTVYPFPTSFRLCDPVLVSKLTGLSWAEFVEQLEDGDSGDPTTMAGMVGVAVWQANPKWTRDRVIRFVENVSMEALDVQGEDPSDADPPADLVTDSPSNGSLAASSPEPKSLSDETATPSSTGTSASDITSLASHRVA